MEPKPKKKTKLLGQDPEILRACLANLLSWFISCTFPSFLPHLVPYSTVEELGWAHPPAVADDNDNDNNGDKSVVSSTDICRCISIGFPGGVEQLRPVRLKRGVVTCGYNITHFCLPPYTPDTILRQCNRRSRRSRLQDAGDSSSGGGGSSTAGHNSVNNSTIPKGCVLLQNECFSVNYADCTIRWGLYESANKFVGYPIVPGFDVAGTIEAISPDDYDASSDGSGGDCDGGLKPGDRVFGCTLFGAYSSWILVPARQLRKIPKGLTVEEAAALPAVSLTALYALDLAGHLPRGSGSGKSGGGGGGCSRGKLTNRSILIHSAAGGVGSMLVQMSKILNLHPIVGIVGSTSKIDEAKRLGCDIVIDKSKSCDVWAEVEEASPLGYGTIMDANGVSTLQQSYDHLCPTGRLIVFGFHSNLPMGKDVLSPMEWIRMARKGSDMPKFDPLDMVTANKSVLGFNLSFFADEVDAVGELLDVVCGWVEKGVLRCPRVTTMEFGEIGRAHELLQSGKSVGKIVMKI